MRNGSCSRPADDFTTPDAWLLGRLRNGMARPDDLSEASAGFEPIARTIYSVSLSGRDQVIDRWLSGRTDAKAIKQAALNTDPRSATPPPAEPRPRESVARLICLADITAMPVDWLWSNRVPLGMLTMFAGDPKLGKSYLTLTLAAAVSRGAPMPFGEVPEGPASVLIMSAEDDPVRTIVPRLKAAGADQAKIHVLPDVILSSGDAVFPSLDCHLDIIEAAAVRLGDCRLLLIDPISAYLGAIDDHRNADLRALLAPLSEMAERLRIAVVLVSHLSKGGGVNGKHRVMGSMAYVGVCRANTIFIRDQTDPSGRRVLFCDNGGNLAPPAPTLAFSIEERPDGTAVVFQPESVSITTEQVLAAEIQGGNDHDPAPERNEARRWLKEILFSGPRPAREVEAAAKNCGFSRSTLRRAKEGIGIISVREGFGEDARWLWKLPESATEDVSAA